MSQPRLVCPSCGSSNIVDDELYSQAQMVCVDCGSVVSEGILVDDPVGGPVVSYSRTTAEIKKPCVNQIKGLERVKEIARSIRVCGEIEALALTYFKQAYEHESFIRVTLQKKEILAGCCVLVSCRQMNWPVTMGTISSLLNADWSSVGEVYKEMVNILNIKAPAITSITDVIEAHCQEYKINSPDVPGEFAEDLKVLTKRATALVNLAADTWIVTGRRPLPIMMAAVYLAWQSLKPNKHRMKVSLEKFCQVAKVKKHRPALSRITELKGVLCKLGNEIPWLMETVTPDNVIQQLGDILEHRNSLKRRALRAHEDAMHAACQSSSVNPPTGEAASQVSEHVDQTVNAPSVEQHDSNSEREIKEYNSHQSQEPNWGKRVLFAPPCVIRSKRRKVEQPELVVTGDEEISDSEIDSYLRSPQEVRAFAQTQKMLSLLDSRKV